MTGTITRRLYRQVIRLYPEPFQQEFGEEMLDVFDECKAGTGTFYLLTDGLLAAFRQQLHFLATPIPAPTVLYSEVPSSPALARTLATAALTLGMVLSVFVHAERSIPHYSRRVYTEHRVLYLWSSNQTTQHHLVRSRLRRTD